MSARPGPADIGPVHTLDRAQAEAIAAVMNKWCEHLQHLGPVPLHFHVTNLAVTWHTVDGPKPGPAVQLTAVQPTGPHVMFLTPEQADELAGFLTDYARLARTGLTLGGNT